MPARSVEIKSLWVRDFRCIENTRIDCSADEIWLVGPNASGKTSLLEAIYVLFRGHSFLSARHGPLVRIGADEAEIMCRVHSNARKSAKLSCLIKGRACHARLDGAEISYQSLAQQAGLVRFFGANAQELISGEPRIRRNFVDWNLFHVEPSYRSLSTKYLRLLHQRNAALKTRAQPIAVWDTDLAAISEQIAAHRERYLNQITHEIYIIGERLLENRTVNLSWSHGWPMDLGMEGALRKNVDSDRRRGFTQCGAHRFNATLSIGSNQTTGSRGEQKLLAAVFQMACETLQTRVVGKASIWLIDDAFSELTHQKGALLVNELRTCGGQIFFAGMFESTEPLAKEPLDRRVFHVEHGAIPNNATTYRIMET